MIKDFQNLSLIVFAGRFKGKRKYYLNLYLVKARQWMKYIDEIVVGSVSQFKTKPK